MPPLTRKRSRPLSDGDWAPSSRRSSHQQEAAAARVEVESANTGLDALAGTGEAWPPGPITCTPWPWAWAARRDRYRAPRRRWCRSGDARRATARAERWRGLHDDSAAGRAQWPSTSRLPSTRRQVVPWAPSQVIVPPSSSSDSHSQSEYFRRAEGLGHRTPVTRRGPGRSMPPRRRPGRRL